ncbi:hypothetical protein SAMN05880580_10770 [Priestia flexa]|nr:hypothetical protein GA0061087_107212 [Priestia flexa]SIQ63748.1 hypothetical protein SAMN05880580_10770 [Priestia flexa]
MRMRRILKKIIVAVFPILMKEGYQYYKNRKNRSTTSTRTYK